MASAGPAAEAARAEIREISARKGHAVDNATAVLERLDAAFAEGTLQRTPFLDQATADLRAALEHEDDQKLGGKSGEAARFILRAIDVGLDDA